MTRKLAAIIAADVVGYSALMSADEAGALEALRKFRSEILGPTVSGNDGEITKSMGDGWLISFSNAVGAVNAAMRLQDRLAGDPLLQLRIGVHIGDVTQEGDDLFGDVVNVASRLEGTGEPGKVMISDSTYYSLDGTLAPAFDDAGEQTLKNILRPIRVFARAAPVEIRSGGAAQGGFPQLSVAPVTCVDLRRELTEIAETLTDDINSHLDGVPWLSCGVGEDPQSGGYSLRSSLRARGDRMRLDVRLTDGTGQDIWAQRFDGILSDSFDWQDRVVQEVVDVVFAGILEVETAKMTCTADKALTAEKCLLMGMMAWSDISLESSLNSLSYLQRSIDLDPDLPEAYAEAILITIAMRTVGYVEELSGYFEQMPGWVEAGRRIATRSPMLELMLGVADFMKDGDAPRLSFTAQSALRRSPFNHRVLLYAGWGYVWSGQPRAALECFEKANSLGHQGPAAVGVYSGSAVACIQLGLDEQAIAHADKALGKSSVYATPYLAKACALAMLDRTDDARRYMNDYRRLVPEQTVSRRRAVNNFGGSEGGERFFDAMSRAGLQE